MPLRVWSSLFLNHPVGTKVMALFRYLAGDFLQSEIVQLLATGRASILDKNWTVWCNNIASSQNWTLFLSFYIVNRPEVLVNYKDWNKQPDVHKWNKIGLWTWYFRNWTISPEFMWNAGWTCTQRLLPPRTFVGHDSSTYTYIYTFLSYKCSHLLPGPCYLSLLIRALPLENCYNTDNPRVPIALCPFENLPVLP